MESSKLHEISIIDHELYIDGISIKGLRDFELSVSTHAAPELSISMLPSQIEAETLAKLELKPELTDIYDAIKCIRMYMILDHEFKKAVIASAKSVIDEIRNANRTDVVNDYEMASRIVERIFMGERK